MLPATPCSTHAPLAWRAFLGSCAADGDNLFRVSRALGGRAVRPVARLRPRRSFISIARCVLLRRVGLRCGQRHGPHLSALDRQRRRRGPSGTPEHETGHQQPYAEYERPGKSSPAKAPVTRRAETPARPHAPAHALDAHAALSAKVRLIHLPLPSTRRAESVRRDSEARWCAGDLRKNSSSSFL